MKFNQKFSIHFWPAKHKENKQGLRPIYARIQIEGARAEVSVKRNIDVAHWDAVKERVKSSHLESSDINQYLSLVHAEISKWYNILLTTKDNVTPEDVKDSFTGGAIKKGVKKGFMEYFADYIVLLEKKVKAGDLSRGRFKHFEVLYRKCTLFLKHKFNIEDISPRDMKLKFIVAFEQFVRFDQHVGHNTTMKICKDLKQVMGYVVIEEDLPRNVFLGFKCTYKKVKRRYLNEEALAAIENKFFSIARLDEVRDCFVFCCYTGYAYGDAADLSLDNIGRGIDGSLWIIRDRGKTDEFENVPLLPKALSIIEKYKEHPYCKKFNKLLPMNSNTKYNAYLKEVADLCGVETKLTSHVARHTCATTVLLTNDVPIETVQEFLGHSDIRTTRLYAKIVQKKLSNDLNVLKLKMEKQEEVKTKIAN